MVQGGLGKRRRRQAGEIQLLRERSRDRVLSELRFSAEPACVNLNNAAERDGALPHFVFPAPIVILSEAQRSRRTSNLFSFLAAFVSLTLAEVRGPSTSSG